MIRKILVGIDFSEHSKTTLKYATQLANKLSADITLIHSYTLPLVNFETGYIPPIEDIQKEAEAEMNVLLNSFSGFKYNTVIKMGFATEVILEYAEEHGFDLIILGIVGQGFVKKHLIGSTAYQVCKESRIPVLIIPKNAEYKSIQKIAFACDFHHDLHKTELYLKVKNIVQYIGSSLEIISVVESEKSVDVKFAEEYLYFEKKMENVPHEHFFVTHDKATEGILEFIKARKSDWLIISPLKHSIFEKLFKESVTKEIVFHSPIPVLSIHE
ncbi:MAG: universal stress protein [Bacteroidia bacterium]|nr:universal stress protein [Bacteroidia bacterium]